MKQQQDLSIAEERERFFILLYQQVFPAVASYISKKGGTLEDAKDVFQDSVVAYYEKVVTTGQVCVHEQAYLMGICKNLWLKKFKSGNHVLLDENMASTLTAGQEQYPSSDKLLNYLQTTGQKCMELLKAFYYDRLSVRQIAGLFGYSGEHSATVQKYKCLEKVRDSVKQKALNYEDFIA